MLGQLKRMMGAKTPLMLDEAVAPTFIVGSGRSGNTLLRRLLMAGPEIYIPPETYVLGGLIRDFPMIGTLPWAQICRLVLGAFITSEDFDTFPSQDVSDIYKSMLALPEAERSLAGLLSMLYMHWASLVKPEATRWGDKTPMNAAALPDIAATYPKARFIHIYRDGFDVVVSYCKMGRYSDPEDAARRWLSASQACRAFLKTNPARMIEMRYEDLVSSPEAELERACRFLDLSYDPSMISAEPDPVMLGDLKARAHYANVGQGVNTGSIGKGRAALDDATTARVAKIIGPQMAELGYT
jgi:hypothetical protein